MRRNWPTPILNASRQLTCSGPLPGERDEIRHARPRATNPLTPARRGRDIRPVSKTQDHEKFRSFLARKGLRATNQRLAILDAALAQPDHFTAEQLLGYARSIDDSVARATVYRTLPIMTESALLREVDIGAGEKYYRANRAGQDSQVAQVVCLDCDRIFEIGAPFMSWYGNSVSSKLGLTPVSQRLQVSARCDALRDTGTCPRRPASRSSHAQVKGPQRRV